MCTTQISMDREPIWISGNAMLNVPGNTSRIKNGQLYTVEQGAHHCLPHGLVVNSLCETPKARRILAILINTTDKNIWIRQPLLAAELFEVEIETQWYPTEFNHHEGDEIFISFILAPPCEGKEHVESNAVEVKENPDPPKNVICQWHIQSLERDVTLGRSMILKKKKSGYHFNLIWGMLPSLNSSKISCNTWCTTASRCSHYTMKV